ncbi:MAG: hypothetical protein B6I25_04525 [Planctomycetales bacterium 4572_13]|nr:MAG: hypothetical protein B6I25_04525 [Planctomycetales bacterium 4572_13]
MIWLIVTVCLLPVALAAVWFSPLRERLLYLFSSAYLCLLRGGSIFDRFQFTCRVEQFSDESQPVRQDQFFRIQILGRIPTEQDNVDTDVQIEILDITEGRSHWHQVLSGDEQYRDERTAEFHSIQHNGIVPDKNAVLARWVTVAQFPCHILRFAYRGRRKLLFRATVIDTATGGKMVSAQRAIEYVYCSDGYREVHGRRLEVLGACVELSAMVLGAPPYSEGVRDLWSEWIRQKADVFVSADEAVGTIKTIQSRFAGMTMQPSSDIILAYGKNADRFFAIELALQTASLDGVVSKENLEKLFQASQMLEIQHDRFLSVAQKRLLSSDCRIEDPSQLLGITSEMDDDSFRKQLNDEYRKWNARVTHPDARIRSQAERTLTLIAKIRSQSFQSSV